MFSAEGLGEFGDPSDIREFFIAWAGEFGEDPLTAAWLVIPTLKKMQVLASERLWFDEPGTGGAAKATREPVAPASDGTEPEVTITIKAAPRQTGENNAR